MADNNRLALLVERITSTSNADFVKRLLDEKRKVLKNNDGTVSTHELGYVDDGNGNAIVFPDVQSQGDSLARFPFPQSLERAIQNRDTVQMSVPDAELFTTEYKSAYPGFNKYGEGGDVILNDGEYQELAKSVEKSRDNYSMDTSPENREAYIDNLKRIGEATLLKYPGILAASNWASSDDRAKKYLTDNGIVKFDNSEMEDFFKSYSTSEGIDRILANQKSWWEARHPYRKYLFSSGAKALKDAMFKGASVPSNMFVMEGYPQMSFYTPRLHSSFVYRPFLKQYDKDVEHEENETMAHEYAHGMQNAGDMTGYSFSEFDDKFRGQKEALEQNRNTKPGHDSYDTEKHADIQGIKWLLFKEGIYDARGSEDITPEKINELREKYPNLRFFKQVEDNERAAWFINNVASNSNVKSYANIASSGGIIERYGSDKVRDALLRIRGQHRFDGNSEDGSLIMRTDNNGNIVDSIEPAIITSKLPAKFNGSQAAAKRYAEAEKFGRKVINKTNKIAPYVFEGLLTTASLPYVITPGLIGGLKRLPKVLANPALAKTKIGAALATYADAYGLVSGVRELSNDVNKVIDGDYKISDVPKTLLDATILVPGSSIITNPDNFLVAKNTIRDFASDPLRPIRDIKTGIDNIKIYSSAVKDRDNIREGLKYALFKYNKTYEKLTDNDILNFGPQYKDWLVRSKPLPTRLPMVRIYSPFESIFHSGILGSYNKPIKRVSMNPYHYSFLKTAWSNPKEAVNNMIGVAAHEGSHWTHMGLSDAGVRLSIPGDEYYIANYSHPLYKDVLSKFRKLDTAWRRSPEEYVAEMTNYQFLNSIPAGAPYEKWEPDARYMVNKLLSKRFRFPMDETEYITKSLSDYGFSNGGKLR